MNVRLVRPDVSYRATYLRGLAELQNEGWLWYADYDLAAIDADFAEHVRKTRALETHVGGHDVPETEFWGVLDGEFVGRLSIRHALNESLREVGGHVSYDVVPRARGRGIATAMLGRALPIARGFGLDEILLTALDDNAASARVIEANGGRWMRTREIMGGRLRMREYCIKL